MDRDDIRRADARHAPPRRVVVLHVVAGAALAAILAVNLAGVAVGGPENFADHLQPLNRRADPELVAVAATHSISLRDSVLLYLQIGQVADGRPVITYPGALDPYHVFGLSRTEVVIDEEYEPDLPGEAAERLQAYPAYESAEEQQGRWTVVPATDVPPGSALRVHRHDGRLYIVDEAVLAVVIG